MSSKFVYGSTNGHVNLGGCILLHPGQNVTVKIERNADTRMAQALLRDLRMYPARKKLGCV